MFSPRSMDFSAMSQIALTARFWLLVAITREGYVGFGLGERFEAAFDRYLWVEAIGIAGLLAASVLLRGPGSAFIYFQF